MVRGKTKDGSEYGDYRRLRAKTKDKNKDKRIFLDTDFTDFADFVVSPLAKDEDKDKEIFLDTDVVELAEQIK